MRIRSVRRLVLQTVPLLAALAAIALLIDRDAVQIVSAVVALLWALWMVRSPPRRRGEEAVSWPALLVRLLPVFAAGIIAEAIASDHWFPFTFAALALALVIPWAAVLHAWERRRATREPS